MSLVEVGGVQPGERGTLEAGVAAGDLLLGDVVVLGRTNPADGELLYVVPPGKTFVGGVDLVVAVSQAGRFAVTVDGQDVCGGTLAAPEEPLSVHNELEAEGGSEIRVEAAGRCHVLVRGHLR